MQRIVGCKSAGRMWRYVIIHKDYHIKRDKRWKELARLGYMLYAKSSHITAFMKVEKSVLSVLWFNDVPIWEEPISFWKGKREGKRTYPAEITLDELKVIHEYYKREGI